MKQDISCERNRNVDILRGYAISLVVLGHAIIIYPQNLHLITWCRFLYDLICSFHMPLFFFISGFIYHYFEKGLKGYIHYIKNKAKRLLVPYLIFSGIQLIPRYIFVNLVNKKVTSLFDGIINIFTGGGIGFYIYCLVYI